MTIKELYTQTNQAYKRIEQHILKTPLIYSHALSDITKGEVYLKLESEQYTGSFKIRGSLNKLIGLSETNTNQRLITASTGNHALGFAHAIEITGHEGTIYLPHTASKAKIEKLNYYPVKLERYGNDSLATEMKAKRVAMSTESIWVSPYNDYNVIAGQGTIALELLQQVDILDEVLVTVGGGGLISGIGSYLKSQDHNIRLVACQPANSPEMTLSLRANKIVNFPDAQPTLSDGSAGGIEPNAITFPLCQHVIDHSILVSEQEICSALRLMLYEHGKIIEGAAAVTIASLIKGKERFKDKRVVLIICGGNIDLDIIKSIL